MHESREHRRAIAAWHEIQRTLPACLDRAATGLTICSVGFRARTCLDRSHRLMQALNPATPLPEWLVLDNNTEPHETLDALDPRFTIVRAPSRGFVLGYDHAIGISTLLQRVKTRFLLLLDPDCFLVRPGWIAGVLQHLERHELGFFGTPINPRRHNSYRYFPYMVCMFVDLARVPLRELCFVPDVWRLGASLGYRLRRSLTRVPIAGFLARGLLTEQYKTNGWRIKERFGRGDRVHVECVQPVWDVDAAVQGGIKRLVHALTPASVSPVPKRAGYCAPAGFKTMGAPDVDALGWEEFVWHGEPFAFHIGSVHGKPGKYEADLARVLPAFERRERQLLIANC